MCCWSKRPGKPCSVEDDYLSMHVHQRNFSVQVPSFPYQIWVSRLWGLPRCKALFPMRFVTVALSGRSHAFRFSERFRRHMLPYAWGYGLPQHNQYKHHSLCEHGLSSSFTTSNHLGRLVLFYLIWVYSGLIKCTL